jgi:hypothetical protein
MFLVIVKINILNRILVERKQAFHKRVTLKLSSKWKGKRLMLRSCEMRVSRFNRFMVNTGASLTRHREAFTQSTVLSERRNAVNSFTSKVSLGVIKASRHESTWASENIASRLSNSARDMAKLSASCFRRFILGEIVLSNFQ